MNNWPEYRLGELCTRITVGHVGSMTSRYTDKGVPFLRSQNIKRGHIDFSSIVYIDQDFHEELTKSQLKPGDLVIVRTGEPGTAAVVPAGIGLLNCSDLVIATPKSDMHAPFLCYAINETAQGFVRAHTVGAVQQHFNVRSAKELVLRVPSLEEQRAISGVLGALDDKIAINERIAATARSLSRVRGENAIRSHVGEIGVLGDYITITKGLSYSSMDLEAGDAYLVTLKCIDRSGTFQHRGLKPYSGRAKPSQFVKHGDVVVAQTDLTQRAEVLGRAARVVETIDGKHLVASLDLAIVRPTSFLTSDYLEILLGTREFREHASAYANGTTVLHLNARALPEFTFPVPDAALVDAVTNATRPLFDIAVQAQRESHVISNLRDTLLPQLMSGRLRVRDAEMIVEDAL
ncbi:restriction endonuclease subunit S [Microbispora triticiradicis]|uniref:Type I restriction modification DNA specificity domain-containing protein n=2 Tax=Microbispora TaxID=2005 RepID=A0ABY3LZI7_9ACTN|nr:MULTISPECIES: restriction endonuclease subunit S [Microbispora]TLP63896.1 hypothetical protein FED44_06595 [Microbispora fusca]TYB60737.1 hypothetical protein FXF59_12665 [Microbispora tritici]